MTMKGSAKGTSRQALKISRALAYRWEGRRRSSGVSARQEHSRAPQAVMRWINENTRLQPIPRPGRRPKPHRISPGKGGLAPRPLAYDSGRAGQLIARFRRARRERAAGQLELWTTLRPTAICAHAVSGAEQAGQRRAGLPPADTVRGSPRGGAAQNLQPKTPTHGTNRIIPGASRGAGLGSNARNSKARGAGQRRGLNFFRGTNSMYRNSIQSAPAEHNGGFPLGHSAADILSRLTSPPVRPLGGPELRAGGRAFCVMGKGTMSP